MAGVSIVAGKARKMLEDEDDLVALKAPANKDMFSRLIQDHWPLQVTKLPHSLQGNVLANSDLG